MTFCPILYYFSSLLNLTSTTYFSFSKWWFILVALIVFFVVITYLFYKKLKRNKSIEDFKDFFTLNKKNRFSFADEIINKGKSLVIATKKTGELIYCSENVIQILGYMPEEVLGMGFWELTEDPEFIGEAYHEDYIRDRIYTRKLKCRNGQYKYIQWIDKQFGNDLFVGIGHDVTEQINIENKYRDLIESAKDIIFEIDSKGKFMYVNSFSGQLLQYSREELVNMHFSELIREDYREKITQFYIETVIDEGYDIEFPILKKSGEEVWVSQKVTIRRDETGKVMTYLGIARDITAIARIEQENKERHEKMQRYTQALSQLSASPYLNFEKFEDSLKLIFENVASVSNIPRISFWLYKEDYLECVELYELEKNEHSSGKILYKKDYPVYFENIEKESIIIASDALKQKETAEFAEGYLKKFDIKSMLDYPIVINGKLFGALCYEITGERRFWDYDDINFTRSITELITLSVEFFKRKEIEEKIKYKSNILFTLTQITEKVMGSQNVISLMPEILEEIGKATKVDRAYYFAADETKRIVSQEFEWCTPGIEPQIDNHELKAAPYEAALDIIVPLKAKKIYKKLVKNIYESEYKEIMKSQNILSVIIFPIIVKNKLFGFIGFDDCKTERIWTDDEINPVQTLMNYISSTIEKELDEKLLLESQERFRLLADNIPGTVYLSKNDEKWTKIYLNDEIEKLTGYPKSDFLNNTISYMNLIHPDEKESVIKSQLESLKKGEKIHQTYRIIKKDGSVVWVEEFGDIVKRGSEIDYIEGIFIDITQKKLQETAVKEKELAIAASKAKSEFLANMSHEIRTPLNGIIGFTDLLMKSKLEKVQKKYMHTVNQSAKSLMDLINDILDFSKIESGNLELVIEETNLEKLTREVIDAIRFDAKQKKLDLDIHINDDVPVTIWTDPLRMRQILINLLGNAVKFTFKGKVKLKIEVTSKIDTHQTMLRFSVSDTGIGIKPENHKKIFEAFSQEDNSTTRQFGGTGLGLSITNKLLGMMGSKLELESELNKGSTFYFDIEVQSSSKDKRSIFDIPVVEEEIIYENHRKLNILVVEDNNINSLLAKTLLKKITPNASVTITANGQEAYDKCRESTFDIIFMDIQMPVMNGYESTKLIRMLKQYENVPIIALTAGTLSNEKEKSFESGMNNYITKPIMKGSIENIISKYFTQEVV